MFEEGSARFGIQPTLPTFSHIELNHISESACFFLTRLLLNTTCPVLTNSVDPDLLASEEANWSGSALFAIKYVNFYQQPDWLKLEVGVAS